MKVITFDLDGVYFPDGKRVFINSLNQLGISLEEITRVFAKSPEMNLQYKLGKITDEQYWSWAKSEWKISKTWNELIQLMVDSYSVDEKIVDIVKKAKNNGYKTALCTSNFPARINGLQNKFGFLDNFDIKVISYQVGYNKPEKGIFECLVKASNVEPNEIVFADDNLDSVNSAKSVGITTFVYENFQKYIEQLKSVGVNL